jgi:uncharacterized membrane protein
MHINPVIFVILGIITTATAQILLKASSSYQMFEVKWCFYLLSSLMFYVFSFLNYYLALKHYEISKVSPIMMASIVSIVALSGLGFGESFSILKVSGIILAIISIFLIYSS